MTPTCCCSTCLTGATSPITSAAISTSSRSWPVGARYGSAMPSKKQRRRQQKLKRHEWEYVQLDEEGNEVPLEPAQVKKAAPNGKPAATRARRPVREVKPPSWRRAIKRAAIFVPLLFVFLEYFETCAVRPRSIGPFDPL